MSHVDPGLDEPMRQAEKDVERNDNQPTEDQAKKEEEVYLDPGRWWLASTAFPLIAGTFGPISNAFSICALAIKWRVYIPPDTNEAHGQPLADPKWLTAINAISLAFALVANIALSLSMARRLSFGIAQAIIISGWYIASFLLIGLVAACSTSMFLLQPKTDHALTQAYYYGIIAAALYFIIASMMVMTTIGAYTGHYRKGFKLTSSQRTLMLQTIMFMVYLLLGALVYSHIEGWPFLDALFWAEFTLLTVGLGGEFVPLTHSGRGLLFPYAIAGIVMLGLVVGSVRSLALERGKQKMSARLLEMRRESVIRSLDNHEGSVKLGAFEKIKVKQPLSERERREEEFKIMRRVQRKADKRRRYYALAMSSLAACLLWCLGAMVFWFSEKPQGWSYFVSLYFTYTTLLTIGYGDYTPQSNSAKPFFVFWTLLAVPTLTILISNMGDTVIQAFEDLTIWLGSITVLPDEGGFQALKVGFQRLREGKLYKSPDNEDEKNQGSAEEIILDRLARHMEEEEIEEAEEAETELDSLERDIRFYHFVLAKEIRALMKDVSMSPPKEYTYHEWAYFLLLLGQDESDASHHTRPGLKHTILPHEPDLGTAEGVEHENRWSWLGIRSPLMSNQSEAQWLLERLTMTLELEMRKMQPANRKEAELNPPPISMRDFRSKHRKSDPHSPSHPQSKSTSKSLGPDKLLDQGVSRAEVRRRHG
ncbi:voltage-gated potassium channel [Westerdykella ornata]|uniref:Voltage-gated potassium channel n=1 Tax=Westerdykella ornata TaxID=318751 RepID=A0A6A6JEN7_WESOR|nr:voltage-gated potassium channel [Westerdykella ornata]KAF2273639.1 voltage-gated potassium channel [Westerdykella ornata]